MPLEDIKLSYDLRIEYMLLFITLGSALNCQSENLVKSIVVGAGYGILVYLLLFILSLIPVVGQLILYFFAIPWTKSIFNITAPNMFVLDIIAICFSIVHSINALLMYGVLASQKNFESCIK